MTIRLKVPPSYAPGYQVPETLRRGIYFAKSEPINASDVTASTDGKTWDVFSVPANTMIVYAGVKVVVATTSTGYVAILGDSDVTNRYLANTVILPASTAGERTPAAVLHEYTTDQTIQLNLVGSSDDAVPSQGQFIVYVGYVPKTDKLMVP